MDIKHEVARSLLSIEAVFLRPQEPFTWASGIKSPIYCDNRLILTAPEARDLVERAIAETVRREYPQAQVLMGTATAGIAHAAIAAHLLGLPMGYVRSSSKDHGRQNRIEGKLVPGQKVVVVEDLISTGGSVLDAVDALREAGAEVLGVGIEELDQQAGHGRRQMEEIETAEAKLEVLRRQATEQGQLAAGYEELKRAFSQDGIPHNIVRSIVPLFEATATSIISQMSGGHMSIEMRMEKTLKSNSKKEVTALDVIVNDAATGALPYMSRSGGERVKAALSVILALAELKSSTAGVQLGFLFIDEPPFLDDKGVQAYCDALEAIQKRYSSLKIMAITHDPEMKARFPQAVDVVKTAEGSKVIYS